MVFGELGAFEEHNLCHISDGGGEIDHLGFDMTYLSIFIMLTVGENFRYNNSNKGGN